MRLRTLGAVLAAVVAMAGLAGCRTNVGTAATVDGQRITESDVNDFVNPAGVAPSVVANAQQNKQTVTSPRSVVLQYLIDEQVFERTLAYLGKVPSEGELAALHDQAASVLLQTSLKGRELDKRIRQGLPPSGISAKLAPVFMRVQELEYAIIGAKQLTQISELVALVKKAGVQVSVSARYGQWDASKLRLDAGVATPGYLTVQPGSKGGLATLPAG